MGVNDFIKVGTQIKEYRQKKGIKQKDIAKRLNIPISTYANYENNHREPTSDVIEQIAEVLETTPYNLMGAAYWDFKEAKLTAESQKFEKFVSYLESLSYIVKVELDEVISSYEQDEFDKDGNLVGKSTIVEEATYNLKLFLDGKELATFTEKEFDELQTSIKDAVDYQIWQKNKGK